MLQSEEHVCEEYKKSTTKQLHSHTSYSTQQEFCLYSKKIQVQLPIPITATPEFKSDIGKSVTVYPVFYTNVLYSDCPNYCNNDLL